MLQLHYIIFLPNRAYGVLALIWQNFIILGNGKYLHFLSELYNISHGVGAWSVITQTTSTHLCSTTQILALIMTVRIDVFAPFCTGKGGYFVGNRYGDDIPLASINYPQAQTMGNLEKLQFISRARSRGELGSNVDALVWQQKNPGPLPLIILVLLRKIRLIYSSTGKKTLTVYTWLLT